MNWLFCMCVVMFIGGILDIIEKKGSNNQPLRFWAIAIFTYGSFNIVASLLLGYNPINNFNISYYFLLLPISILCTTGYYCTIKAFYNADISLVSPILRSKVIWVLILASIFLNEYLTIVQIILIFMILFLIITLTNTKGKHKFNIGVMFAFGYLFANGTANFLDKVVVNIIEDTATITFYSGISTVTSIILILFFTNKLDLLNLKKFKSKKTVLLMEILEVISIYLTRIALLTGNIVIITCMASSSIIITIIFSRIIFKEKAGIKKGIIISLIIISLIYLSYLSI